MTEEERLIVSASIGHDIKPDGTVVPHRYGEQPISYVMVIVQTKERKSNE